MGPSAIRPEVVTICGSMRFYPQMLAVVAAETAAGAIVLGPFVVVDQAAQHTDAKARLDELHRRKIDMADRVVVVTDRAGYVGESTRAEIAYSQLRGVPVSFRRQAVDVEDVVQNAAHMLHREICPDCWGPPDCPSPEEADRALAGAATVLSYGWGWRP